MNEIKRFIETYKTDKISFKVASYADDTTIVFLAKPQEIKLIKKKTLDKLTGDFYQQFCSLKLNCS